MLAFEQSAVLSAATRVPVRTVVPSKDVCLPYDRGGRGGAAVEIDRGGTKVDLNGGSATATAIIGQATSFDGTTVRTGTRVAALNTALCSNASNAAALCQIYGTITVNAAGTFIPRFAQTQPTPPVQPSPSAQP